MHKVLPVKEWLHLPNSNSLCTTRGMMLESIRHCLWDCCEAQQAWMRVARILQKQRMTVDISWGSVVWSSLLSKISHYDSNLGSTTTISILERMLSRIPMNLIQHNKPTHKQSELWNLVSSCTMWHVWRARCSRVINTIICQPMQVVQAVWLELMLSLKAKYDNIKGIEDVIILIKAHFP